VKELVVILTRIDGEKVYIIPSIGVTIEPPIKDESSSNAKSKVSVGGSSRFFLETPEQVVRLLAPEQVVRLAQD
jgi:hypothetical protein